MRFLFLAISCYGLSFVLPGQTEYCFSIDGIATRRIWGEYIISGVGDMNVLTRLFDSKKKIKFASESGTREGKLELIANENQLYELCFKSVDSDDKTVSFELSQNELSQVVTPVSNDGFEPLSDDLSESTSLLEGVYRNDIMWRAFITISVQLNELDMDLPPLQKFTVLRRKGKN